MLIFCLCVVCSLSLSWIGNWKRSITAFPRRSASTYSSSCKTKISKRTRCSPPCPIIAVPVQARARPPTAPRPLTPQRPVGALCTWAGTIAPSLWPIPLRRPPRPSCQTQKCCSIKLLLVQRNIQQGSMVIVMWDSNDVEYLLILFFLFNPDLFLVLSTELYYFLFWPFLSENSLWIMLE